LYFSFFFAFVSIETKAKKKEKKCIFFFPQFLSLFSFFAKMKKVIKTALCETSFVFQDSKHKEWKELF
jgi:hypothetical protein